MAEMKIRYSAEIQRAKGLLELAAAVYDTSLSYKTTRAAENALQTDSRVGYSLTLALTTTRAQSENGVTLSFASALLQAITAVLIVSVAAVLIGATAKAMGDTVRVIETVSYALIVLVGARLFWVKGRAFLHTVHALNSKSLAFQIFHRGCSTRYSPQPLRRAV